MTATIRWHCEQWGNNDCPTVLALHGFFGAGKDWRPVAEATASEFHWLCPDLPFHGTTEVEGDPNSLTMRAVADALISLLDAHNIGQCHVVGYSMGGRLALHLAIQHPDRCLRVVLESSSPGLKTTEEQQQRQQHDEQLALDLENISPSGMGAFIHAWYNQPLFTSLQQYPALLRQLIEERAKNDPKAMAMALRTLGTGAQDSLWPKLDTCPRLLAVVGDLDRKYRFIAEQMSELSPNIAVYEMSGCGHNVHVENPDGYTTVIRSFLQADGG